MHELRDITHIIRLMERADQRVLEEETLRALHDAAESARSDWSYLSGLSGCGPIARLEEAFAAAVGVRYALAVSSGTAALFTALKALRIGPEDEVIVPTYTWGQTAAPVLQAGATPVYADIDPLTYTIAPDSIAERISPRTRAVVAVHLFGHPANMPAIVRLCQQHDLKLVEDAAHAFGAALRGRRAGTWGDAACFSLGRGKPITGGEGGILCTNSRRIFELAVGLSQHPIRQHYENGPTTRSSDSELGWNFRIHPLAAVIAHAELRHAGRRQHERTVLCATLNEALADVSGIRPPTRLPECDHAWYRYCPSFVPGDTPSVRSRAECIERWRDCGVPLADDPIGVPLHRRRRAYPPGKRVKHRCPNAEERCFCTGMSLGV